MAAKGVFVDDEDKQYAALLSTRGILEFDYQAVLPLTEQALKIKSVEPTVVALDYRLDEVAPNIPDGHTYKGSALAQLLRDSAIANPKSDFAIVLVSSETKLQALYAPDKTAHDLFDMVYSKEDVTTKRTTIATEVRALSEGYRFLRTLNGKFDQLEILAAGDAERDRLTIQEIATAFSHASAPHIVSKIVLRNFIERPGPLIDDNDAAAILGIKTASFETLISRLTESECNYRGLFSVGWRRWWAHRIEEWAEALLERPPLSLNASERAELLSRCLGEPLSAAPSPWNGKVSEYISFACGSCRRPTEMRHSLAAFSPRAPKFATRRRICWDCIQTDEYRESLTPIFVEEIDEPLVEEIKKRDRRV